MSASRLLPHKAEIQQALADDVSRSDLRETYGVPKSTLDDFIRNHINTSTRTAAVLFDALREDPTQDIEEVPCFVRDYSTQAFHYIYPLGDVHIGSPSHSQERWQEWIGYLEDSDNVSMLGTGDFLNSALKTSVSETYDETMRVGVAKRLLRNQLRGLAGQGKLDLLMPGNHEDRIYKAIGDCPIEDIADQLECSYARALAVVVYKVGEIEYTVAIRHGTGGGQVGARANRLEKSANTLIADVYVSGHTHAQLIFPRDVFVVDNYQVSRRRQLFVSSGSFLGYEDYAAKMGYTAQKIGAPRIRLNGERHDAHCSI